MHNDPLFDYAPIMLRMEKLQRKIHDNFLKRSPDENLELCNDLLVNARQLQLYVRENADRR